MTALLMACSNGYVKIAELLIERGSDVNLVDGDGYTALKLACMESYVEVVKLLVQHGADVNITGGNGMTALMLAYNSEMCTDLLLQHGANVDVQEKENRQTAVMMVVARDNVNILERLLRARPNLDLADSEDRTVFSYGIKRKNTECLRLLLVEDKLLSGGILRSVHKKANDKFKPLEPLLLTIELGVFEWEWCPLEHFKPVTLAALKSGLCPAKIRYDSHKRVSPLVLSFLENDKELIETILRHRYYFPEDYSTLSTDADIRDNMTEKSLLDDFTLRPMSLQTWSFLAVSKSISLAGPPSLRRHRVNTLTIYDQLKRELSFESD